MRLPVQFLFRLGVGAWPALAAGCASTPNPYGRERPPLPPAAAFADAPAPPGPPTDRYAGPVRVGGSAPVSGSAPAKPPLPDVFGPEAAVEFALENNPALVAVRQQRS
jgi:hypothetical protein